MTDVEMTSKVEGYRADGKLLVEISQIWGYTYIVEEDLNIFLRSNEGDWRLIAQSSHVLGNPNEVGFPVVVYTMGRYEAE
jgi:hypothetical protein